MPTSNRTLLRRLGDHLERLAAERPVFLAFVVFLVATFIVVPVSLPFYLRYPQDFLVNVLAEAHGMLFDLLIIGWFLFWLNKLAERRLRTNRYREEIEDFLGWKSPEATHRIAGNIRRLNRSGTKEAMRLTEAFLKDANLGGATLRKADLWGADLEGANLREADLEGASLAGANLEGADLERARLVAADLRGANLREADLERAHLHQADLRGVTLVGADLQYATLTEANLERSSLIGANLRGAVLERVALHRAVLDGANLRGANLCGADLRDVSLVDVDLLGANLKEARLPEEGEARLALFEQAKTLFGAQLPDGVEAALQAALPHLFRLAYDGEAELLEAEQRSARHREAAGQA